MPSEESGKPARMALFLLLWLCLSAGAQSAAEETPQNSRQFRPGYCLETDFSESRKLVGPLGDFIELRRTTSESSIQIVIHEDPEQGLRAITRLMRLDNESESGAAGWTSIESEIPTSALSGIWDQSGEIIVPIWPMSTPGPVRLQYHSSAMMNSACFEWWEGAESDSGMPVLSRFVKAVFSHFFPELTV